MPPANVAIRRARRTTRRRLPVVVPRVSGRLVTCQDPAVENSGRDDAHLTLDTEGQQLLERSLVEQRAAAGEYHDVDIRFAHEVGEHLGLVHPGTDRRYDSLVSQFLERGIRLSNCLVQ